MRKIFLGFTIHEKINLRSQFHLAGYHRAEVPYITVYLKEIKGCGYSVDKFKSEPYGTSIDGTTFNKKGKSFKE